MLLGGLLGAGMIGGGVWVSTLFRSGPDRFSIENGTGGRVTGEVAGRWTVSPASQAGYRVEKQLMGRTVEVVGRGPVGEGWMAATEREVFAGEFVVELAGLRTDNPQRDSAFRGRIMETETWPEARFTLTQPVDLTLRGRDGVLRGELVGELEMRGRRRETVFAYEARLEGGVISIVARTTAAFADWGISNPSQPGVIVKESAELEVQLELRRQSST